MAEELNECFFQKCSLNSFIKVIWPLLPSLSLNLSSDGGKSD